MTSAALSTCSRALRLHATTLAATAVRLAGALQTTLEQGPRAPGDVVFDVRALAHALPRRAAGLPAGVVCADGGAIAVRHLPLL